MDAKELKRIAHELRAYNPAADEYKGEHIHKVWAREIEAALSDAAQAPEGWRMRMDDDEAIVIQKDGIGGAVVTAKDEEIAGAILYHLVRDMLAAPAAPQAAGDAVQAPETFAPAGAVNLACYLADHCEGETITEESLQKWIGAMVKLPRYNPTVESELASMTRMFHAACADLGAINEALGLDPEDGGAEPILDAIAELKRERDEWADAGYAAAAQPDERAACAHDYVRSDHICTECGERATAPQATNAPDAVARLKAICKTLGLENAIPESVYSNPEGLFAIFGQMRSKIDALVAQATVKGDEPRLDKPAQVGNGRFGVGVGWSTVIGAAQRHHEYMNTPEREAERIAKGNDFWDSFHRAAVPQAGATLTDGQRDSIEYAQQVLRQVEAGDGTFVGQCAEAISGLDALLSATQGGGHD